MAAGSWWVVPEGEIGMILSGLVPGTKISLMHVIQSASKPSGSPVYGPYLTLAQAQAQADEINGAAGAASHAGAAADPDAPAGATANTTVLGLPTFTNLREFATRAVKVIAGVGLLIVGLQIIGKSAGVNQAVGSAAKKAAKVAGVAAL